MIDQAALIAKPLARKLVSWYRRHARNLPWRDTTDPYAIWVSEIMLQQTQVDTAIPYFNRFMQRFPTVDALALAPLNDVLKAWENLGYYLRARNLHRAARVMVDKHQSRVPDTPDDLISLPGIGDYTAGAILSIAFNRPAPAVDGNVRRIVSRLFAIDTPVDEAPTQATIRELVRILVPPTKPGLFISALMDLGATLCRPKSPRCEACPIQSFCRAKTQGMASILPVVRKRAALAHRMAAAAVIHDTRGRLLVVQRPGHGLLASLWKLPGGFVSDPKAIKQELPKIVYDEIGLTIRAGKKLARIEHTYTHFRLTLQAYACAVTQGAPQALTCAAWQWATLADLEQLTFSKADRMLLAVVAHRC